MTRCHSIRLVIPVLFIFSPQAFSGDLSIDSVSVSDNKDRLIVSGNNFGSPPDIQVHDDFDHGLASGDVFNIDRAIKGHWNSINSYYPAVYSDKARTGSTGVLLFSKDAGRAQQIQKKFSDPVQEVFISYWVRLGDNQIFPGDVPDGPRTFSNDSSWKFNWLIDESHQRDSTDLIMPSHVGGGKMTIGGNSHSLSYISNDWWVWDDWMRVSVWLKPDFSDLRKSGEVLFQTLSEEKGILKQVLNEAIFPETEEHNTQFQKFNIPGWVRTSTTSEAEIYYDDVYLATGPGAGARFEIGNNENYSDNTDLNILSFDSWGESEVKLIVPDYHREKTKDYYLFYTDSDGKVNEKGVSIYGNPPKEIEDISVE